MVRRIWNWVNAGAARLELTGIIVLGLAAGAVWGFVELLDEVDDGETERFDRGLLLMLRDDADPTDPLGPGWLEELVRDFTALGGIGVLAVVIGAAIGFLLIEKRRRGALFLALAVTSAWLTSLGAKSLIARPRPDLVPHGSVVYTASFPSGHAMMSTMVWLTLGILIARLHERRAVKVWVLTLCGFVAVMVGFSRVYLGVHWPTDVLAGWMLGAVWAAACWLVLRWAQSEGAVEPPVEDDGPIPEPPVAGR